VPEDVVPATPSSARGDSSRSVRRIFLGDRTGVRRLSAMSARLSGLMNVHRRWLCTFGTLAVALAAGAAVPGLDQYDVFQYINLQGPSPAKIARLDTNGQVLFACRQATSRDALRDAGVTFSESQIQLLEVMGLLREHDGFLITTFPILEPADPSRSSSRMFLMVWCGNS
jgi:hypothetical protein